MTAAIAKTKHRREWQFIHKAGCKILGIDPQQNIDGFMSMAKFISDFTDQHLTPPKTKDFIQIASNYPPNARMVA